VKPRIWLVGSLAQRLLLVLVATLTLVAIGLGAGGALLIERVVEQSFDKLLGASVRAIADTIAPEHGDVTLEIPPSALEMLEDSHRDNVYYNVRQGQRLLTGYAELPALAAVEPGRTVFQYATVRGQRVRIAADARRIPYMPDLVVVEVAQTLGERRALEWVMLAGLIALESTFVAFAALLVWPALKWSLRPVNNLREEIDARPADHANFSPLDLTRTPRELVGLVAGFNRLLRRLEEAVSGMRQFTSDASHQMRTPLAILKTHVAVLMSQMISLNIGAQSLTDIDNAVTRLQLLLTRLLTLARADEAVGAGIRRSAVDLRVVITHVVEGLLPQAASRDITIDVIAEERAVWAYAEPVLATEILANLVDNAIRYNHAKGQIWISIVEHEGYVSVAVEDNGPGVPVEQQEKILERFYRLPRDHAQQGSGLGLSIVKTLAEALSAQVKLSSRPQGDGLIALVKFQYFQGNPPN
jgi:two-component system sensor histidine kinase TctE